MAAKQFYDNTPVETSDVQRWENASSNGTPFYQIEADVVSGATVSGTVFYKRNVDETISSADYTFSAEGLKDGDYCIRANPNAVAENVASLAEAYTSNLFIKLAYVKVSNGSFTDFRLVGDKYLQKQITTAEGRAKKYAEDYAKEKAADTLTAAQEYADIKADSAQTHADNMISAHNTSDSAHGDIRDRIDMLQKFPCYEHAVSGAAVQRFDDVSVIPHNISITVHGATAESGNSVTNPTVSVYGKNLFKTIPKSDGKGYEAVGSIIKITNPSAAAFIANCTIVLGKGTYTLSVEAVGQAELASGAYFQIIYKLGDNQLSTGIPKLNKKYSKILTVDSPTVFSFNQVNMGKVPTSADLSVQIQLEAGETPTDFVEAVEPQTVAMPITMGEGEAVTLDTLNAVSPTMTVIANDDNALVSAVDVTYNRDVGKALGNLQAAIAALA